MLWILELWYQVIIISGDHVYVYGKLFSNLNVNISLQHNRGKWPKMAVNISTFFNTLRPRQNGCHFADDIFKCIFLNENLWILSKISLKFFPKGPINNIPALVHIMAWRRPGDKPLSEAMMVNLSMHICISRPQWVNLSPPSAAYMRQWTVSALVQIMACCLYGAKPLSKSMVEYCRLDP